MDSGAFNRFIRLVELDGLLSQFTRELEVLVQKQQFLFIELEQVQRSLLAAQQVLTKVHKEMHTLELELRTIEMHEKEKKARLSNAVTPKEFFSLEHEIEALQKKRMTYEDPYLKLLSQVEDAQQKAQQLQNELPGKTQELEKQVQHLEEQRKYLIARLDAARKEKASLAHEIPEEVLRDYNSMLEKVPNPVVPIIKESCSACFYTVSQQRLHESRHHKLIKCQDCFRLLYAQSINT